MTVEINGVPMPTPEQYKTYYDAPHTTLIHDEMYWLGGPMFGIYDAEREVFKVEGHDPVEKAITRYAESGRGLMPACWYSLECKNSTDCVDWEKLVELFPWVSFVDDFNVVTLEKEDFRVTIRREHLEEK